MKKTDDDVFFTCSTIVEEKNVKTNESNETVMVRPELYY